MLYSWRWRGTKSTSPTLCREWSTSSHTFIAALGEFCSSLEDVAMLTGLPIFCNFHVVEALDNEGQRLVEELQASMAKSEIIQQGTYLSLVKYFKDSVGKNITCQLVAFFAYWLSYFVSRAHQRMASTASFFRWQPFWPKRSRFHWELGSWGSCTSGSVSAPEIW